MLAPALCCAVVNVGAPSYDAEIRPNRRDVRIAVATAQETANRRMKWTRIGCTLGEGMLFST